MDADGDFRPGQVVRVPRHLASFGWLALELRRVCGALIIAVVHFFEYIPRPTKSPQPVRLPLGSKPQPESSKEGIESSLASLHKQKDIWIHVSRIERAKLLRECRKRALRLSQGAAEAAVAAHGSYGQGIGEERMSWAPVLLALREYEATMRGNLRPVAMRTRDSKEGVQCIVDVFPKGLMSLCFPSVRGEVWLEPGTPPTQARIYREKEESGVAISGKVALVLGAGNQLPVVILDVLHKLISEDEVVLLKMNPVNDFLGPFVCSVLRPFIDRGLLVVAYGGVDCGKHLCSHPLVDSIHLTGSWQTYDAIVRDSNVNKEGSKVADKRVTAELGCFSPIIIVPGRWSSAELDYHAGLVAGALTSNSGHNCTKPELLVMDASWCQRPDFLRILRQKLDSIPQRVAWYPGSSGRVASFMKRFPDAEQLGRYYNNGNIETSPWLLATGLTPGMVHTQHENWCGVLQEVALTSPGGEREPEAFLEEAVDFVNIRCWGSLCCGIAVAPGTQRNLGRKLGDAIANLKYGFIIVNGPLHMAFSISSLTWGAFPGNTAEDIGSGNCCVHNTSLLDYPQKSVLHCPFRLPCPNFWSPTFGNYERFANQFLRFLFAPSLWRAVLVILEILKG